MKSHRKPENEIIGEIIKEAADELLGAEWAAAGQSEIDPALRERVMQAVRKQKYTRDLRRKFVRYGQMAAMLVLTVGVILFCIPTVRAGFVNAVITWYDECFRVEFNPGTDKSVHDEDAYAWKSEAEYLPDGYSMAEQEQNVLGTWTVYENGNGDTIVCHGYCDDALALFDDKFTLEEVVVGGNPGYYMHQADYPETILTWSEGRNVYSITAHSAEITREQLIRMAESLK